MDLDGVILVDVEAVRFLGAREDGGVELLLFFPKFIKIQRFAACPVFF